MILAFPLRSILALLFVSVFAFACDRPASHGHKHDQNHRHENANEFMHSSKFDELTARFEDPARAEWQKPDQVIKYIAEGDLHGRSVADIGAGTGYFSFLFAKHGTRKVIALDVDDRFLDYLRERERKAAADGIELSPLEIRKTGTDRPALEPGEVDIIFLANVYHHIENRIDYFRAARAGLATGGRLVVVDFKEKGDHPVGPPARHRIGVEQVRRELKEAGFNRFKADTTALPYQYILIARI